MTTTARGRHRKLRRNILHTVIATALLAGTFTVVDQSINPAPANAAPGDPGSVDTTFSSVTQQSRYIAIQSDGKIIATSESAPNIRRLNRDGSVDSTFTFTATSASNVKVNPADDSIYVTRATNSNLVQKRLASGLTGTGTWNSPQIARGWYANNMEFIDANSMVVASEYGLFKLDIATGTSDSTFTSNLPLDAFSGSPTQSPYQVKIQTVAGVKKILVAASNGNFAGSLKRYNLDGTLDRVLISNKDFLTVEVVNVDGSNMILAGERTEGTLHVFNEDGTVATNQFAQNIKAAANFGPSAQGLGPRSITVDSVGRITVGGSFTSPTQRLFRFKSDGTADTTFNSSVGSAFPSEVTHVIPSSPNTILISGAFGIKRVWSDPPTIPVLSGTSVSTNGLTITLNYVADLGTNPPSVDSFVVTNAGSNIPVQSVSILNKQVILTMASPIGKLNAVSLAYTAPSANDAPGNAAIEMSTGADETSFTISGAQITNSSNVDQTSPVFVSGSSSTNGLTVTAVFDEALTSVTGIPANFTVSAGGATITPSAVSISGTSVTLTLPTAVERNQTITLAYTPPAVGSSDEGAALRDSVGNRAIAFTNRPITNNSTVDTLGPILSSGVVDAVGNVITLTYNEDLHTVFSGTSAFSITVGGLNRTITGITRPTTRTIRLALDKVINGGEVVSVSYVAPDSNNALTNNAVQDSLGLDSLSVTSLSITNNSTQGPPTIASATIPAAGTTISFSFTKASPLPPWSLFSLLVNGEKVAISLSGTGTNNGIYSGTFNIPSYIVKTGDIVRLVYTAPEYDPTLSNAALQDNTGADSPSFERLVTNNSTVPPDVTRPTLSSTAINSVGTDLTLTFNEALSATTASKESFTVLAGGNPIVVSSVTVFDKVVTLKLASAVPRTVSLSVAYAAPSDSTSKNNAAIQDVSGNDALAIPTTSMTNSSNVGPDIVGPALISMSATGSSVVLVMNENLSSTIPTPNMFTVLAGESAVSVSGVSISGNTVTLTLASAVSASDLVSVIYSAPTSVSGTSNDAIQDLLGNDSLTFSGSNANINPAWRWASTPTNLGECIDGKKANSTRERTLSNGITYSIGVEGEYLCADEIDATLANRAGIDSHFTSTGLVTDPTVGLWSIEPINCLNPEYNSLMNYSSCNDRGFVTVRFGEKVTNPVISFAGWGAADGGNKSWSTLDLVSPGLSLTYLNGPNISVQNGTDLRLNSLPPSTKCVATIPAGCGSIRVNGTMSEIRFALNWNAFGDYQNSFGGWGNLDYWNMVASVTEDFGQAPSSYDSPVASHVFGPLSLGSTVTPDNLGVLYGTTNADQVSAGAALTQIEDGVTTWPSVGGAGSTYELDVALSNVEKSANLCGWIDFNRNGKFDYSERACAIDPAFGATTAKLSWTVPSGSALGTGGTYARIRLSYDTVALPTGKVGSGEVEDYALTLGPPPTTARPDTTSGGQGLPQSTNLLNNTAGSDTAASGATLDAASVKLCAVANPAATPPVTAESAPNCTKTSVIVPGVGTYAVDASGQMVFTPLANYTGTPAPLAYTVMDSAGGIASSTYTPTVIGRPTATADTTSGRMNVAQSINVLTNTAGTSDTAGSGATLDASSLTLACPDSPTTPTCTASGGSVTIAGQGTYTKAANGTVTFTPVTNYSGTPTPVKYTIANSSGQTATSTYTPTIIPPPTVVADTTSAGWDVTQSMNVVASATVTGSFNASLNTGDSAATGTTLAAGSLRLCAPSDTAPNCSIDASGSVVIANQGTYTVNPATGVISFDPLATYTGKATPVTYSITDALGQKASVTYTPTVNAPAPPTADPETTTGAKGAVQTTDLLVGDATSDTRVTLDSSTVRLCPATTTTPQTTTACNLTTLAVVGVGTYTVDSTGHMTFFPEPNYVGTPPAVVYQVTDSMGGTGSNTYTPTVIPPPTANPDTTTGAWKAPQSINVVNNVTGNAGDDVAANGATLDFTSVKISCASAANCTETVDGNGVVTAVTIANQGTYTVDPATGVVTFVPVDSFTGQATRVTYTVSDNLGQTATATYTPTVTAPPVPTASPDTISLIAGSSLPFSSIFDGQTGDNDPALATKGTGGPDLTNSTVCLIDPATSVCDTDGIVVIAGQGTYTLDPTTGIVTYAADANATEGPKTPVTYQITDGLGRSATNTLTPTIYPKPTADDDASSGAYDTNQIITPFSNDDNVPGQQLGNLLLCGLDDPNTSPENEAQSPNNCDKTSVTTPDGVYTVVGNTVVFNPDPDFAGQATVPVRYQAKDDMNQFVNALITPTVLDPNDPITDPEITSGKKGATQTINLLDGDTTAAQAITLVPGSVVLSCTQGVANCTVANNKVTITGVGTYEIDPAKPGFMLFTPDPDFTGPAPSVTYTVTDSMGGTGSNTYTPTVIPPPTANPDTTTGAWKAPQSINVVNNVTGNAGDDVAANGATLDFTSVKISCASAANCTETVDGNGVVTAVTIANQGTYTVDPATGVVTFVPVDSFTGQATRVTYTVSDNLGQTATATYTPTVLPPARPTADPETTSGAKGVPQSTNLLDGDLTSDPGITLVSASVRLCPSTTTTPQITTACTLETLVVPSVGTYTVVDGVMTFAPEPNYVGTPPAVVYQVTDSMGGKASSTYTPNVIAPPTVRADSTTAGWDVPQTMNVVTSTSGANTTNTNTSSQDSAAPQTTLKANSLTIDCASAIDCTETVVNGVVTAVTMTGQGTYTVTANNTITFDPVASFVGTARPVTYSISDELNQVSSTTYTPKVVVPLPVANPETKVATLVLVNPPTPVAPTDPNYQDYLDELNFGPMHWTKTFTSVLQGTGALATGSGLKSGSTDGPCLIDPVTSVCSTSVTIPGEGTYTMDQTTGVVTFVSEVVEYDPSGSNITPGPKTPVTYRVTDAVGRTVTSTLTPIIPPPPVANPDVSTGVQGVPQTLSPVGNDNPGGGASTTLYPDTRLQTPSGIYLCDATQPPPDCTSSSVEVNDMINGVSVKLGVLTVTATGLVVFTPEPDFIGTTPPIGYQIPDNLGQKAYSTITITVLPPPAPSANFDTGSAEYNKPVTLKPWLNDSAGAVPEGSALPAPNLIATSIRLCDDNETIVAMSQTAPDCTAMKVTTIEGTYEVNPETGEVVFTPVDGFIGTVKFPPTYQIWTNWEGTGLKSATSLLIPTIAPPGAPAAEVDVTVTKPGTSVVLNPVENDIPGATALDPKTVRLCGADEISPECTQMSVTTLDGTYVVDPETGKVTFTPRDGFTGKATIPYVIKDSLGMVAASHLIITVEDTAVVVPVIAPQTPVVTPVVHKKQLPKTGGTRPDLLVLLGLAAIAGAGGLRVASRRK